MAFGGENAESYYDEGLTAGMRGDLAQAMQNFEKCIRLDATMVAAYHQLAKCYMRLGRDGDAVQLLRQVLIKRPENTAARVDLGFALIGAGRIEEARKQLDQVLALEPGNSRAHLAKAQACFEEGEWAGAMAEVQNAIANGGSNFAALYLLGRAARLAGNLLMAENMLKKADAVLEKSLEASPDKPEGHYLRGEVAFVQEKYPAAMQHYRAAQDRAVPGKSYSAYGEHFTLLDVLAKQGLCLQRLGQVVEAREIGERIGKMDPEHRLGKALRESE